MMKNTFFIVLSLLITLNCYAQSNPKQVYAIVDLSGGLNSHAKPDIIKDNQCMDVRNMRFNSPYGAVSKRTYAISYGVPVASAITSLHRYYNSSGTQQLIATGSTKIFRGNDAAGTFAEIGDAFTDGARWQWVNYKDITIGVNGTDIPIKYDGHTLITANTDAARTASNLVANLCAPFAELNTGSNLDASSWYQYKIAFYDDTSYTYSTSLSNPILTGSTVRNIRLTGIPLGEVGTTHRYIYRTAGQATEAALSTATYYMCLDVSDNTTTETNDTVTDTTLETDRAPTWTTSSAGTNITPPKTKLVEIHDERIFLGNIASDQSAIMYSDPYNPDIYPALNIDYIRQDDGDEVTFLKIFLGTLVIGKTNTIQQYYTKTSTFYASDPFSFIGCPAIYSAISTPMGILYVGRKGVYSFNGQVSTPISDIVTPQAKDVNQLQISDTAATYFDNKYFVSYTSEDSGEVINNRVLIYDLIRKTYTLDYRNINCFGNLNSGTDLGTMATGSSDSDGRIYLVGEKSPLLTIKLKSEMDQGTYDDSRTTGEEDSPSLEIAWDITIDEAVGTINTGYPNAIIDRPDTDGNWTSPVYQINAGSLDTLYWNEQLGSTGDVTFQMRTGATTPVDGTWSAWSAEFTDPSGADVSSVTANTYIQFKINLSTSNIIYSPYVIKVNNYVFRLAYNNAGQTSEKDIATVTGLWQSGWRDFRSPRQLKMLDSIRIYYKTDLEGELTFSYENKRNDFSDSFTIDLTINSNTDIDDDYTYDYVMNDGYKVYTYYTPDVADGNVPTGEQWRFKIVDNGSNTGSWQIDRIEAVYTVEPNYD